MLPDASHHSKVIFSDGSVLDCSGEKTDTFYISPMQKLSLILLLIRLDRAYFSSTNVTDMCPFDAIPPSLIYFCSFTDRISNSYIAQQLAMRNTDGQLYRMYIPFICLPS